MVLVELKKQLGEIVVDAFGLDVDPKRFRVDFASDPAFGDFAVNAALVYAKEAKLSPREAAEKLAPLIERKVKGVGKVEVAGPGFINITIEDKALVEMVRTAPGERPNEYAKQVVVTEFSDPNPFKVLHVGHLYTSIVGDAITRLIAAAGGEVHPVNFGGDVGLHVAKTMWAILKELGGEHPDKLEQIDIHKRSEWMAKSYVVGTGAYDDDEDAKKAIIELNQKIYKISGDGDHESPLAEIYWTCRQWSYDYFDAFYARMGIRFDKYYPESETAPVGLKIVKQQVKKGVYIEDQGAIVFVGEKYGLHTRVFVTSKGLPTYEGKDVGLLFTKWDDYHFDRSVVITSNEIDEYMKVVLKSVDLFAPELSAKSSHITHGNVKLSGGTKMSSRKGNFLGAIDVLDIAAEANREINKKDDEQVTLGAVKYAFLKTRIGSDLVFVPEDSVSLEGNSGPYLQYAHARARSILAKTKAASHEETVYEKGERILARKIVQYPEVMSQAVAELMPHVVCTYLYELAQTFNRFYETNRVVSDSREAVRAELVRSYADILKNGLRVLGIAAPDRL
jgi:arginyl-tRNA synthetase